MLVFETERLKIRWLEVSDQEFIFKLLNEPGWINYIGDKGIRSLEDAKNYILTGPRKMYERVGFGLFMVELKESQQPVGLCGLIKRDGLEDVDIGYAFLAEHQSKGFAFESAKGNLEYARKLGLDRIVAITTKDNASSSKLLEKLGMSFEGYVTLPQDDEELKLYAIEIAK
ncbi:GNAT family N-acetyltransferase [Mesobacillus subterraneus]|uniref:N-acetyltransferase n=1 Tax=Mesobacillus subterraneus TaxID=285983 RepID=A0A3R9E8N8_9BACI|nr:GNAT family N-acetyltransferase [Mesobacillus subterraneus]RSD28483.1 N-acetyltransferase [Mesobacillus subterraneus]